MMKSFREFVNEQELDEVFDTHVRHAHDMGAYDKKVGKEFSSPYKEGHPLYDHYKRGYDSCEMDQDAKASHERLEKQVKDAIKNGSHRLQ